MILVTGGTGLVGTHLLLHLLQEGMAVTATYRTDYSLEAVKKVFSYYDDKPERLFSKIKWVQADLNDLPALEKAFEGVRYVYHCAALISFDPTNFRILQKVNAEGTANIVNTCLAHEIKKLCYVSSIATIGTAVNGSPAAEDNFEQDRNANVYALSKYAAEMEVWRGAQEGLPVVIINPGIILGPGFWDGGSGMFFRIGARGLRRYPSGGTGFVGVWDVVRCMVMLMKSDILNERYIIVERNMHYREVLDLISGAFGLKRPKKPIHKWQLELLWRLDWVSGFLLKRKRRLTRNAATSLREFNRYSNAKVMETLGFSFRPMEEVVVFSCEQYQRDEGG